MEDYALLQLKERYIRPSSEELKRAARLQQMRQYKTVQRASESEERRSARLQQKRQYDADRRASESEEKRAAGLQQMQQYRASESKKSRAARLQQRRQYMANWRASQSHEERAAYSQQKRQYQADRRASESEDRRAARLQQMREYGVNRRASESEEKKAARLQRRADHRGKRAARLQQMRQYMDDRRASTTDFAQATNTLCDKLPNDKEYQIEMKKIRMNPDLIQEIKSSAHKLTTQKDSIAESEDMIIEDISSCNAGLKIITTGTPAIMQENVKIDIKEELLEEGEDSLDIIYEPIVSEQIKKELDDDHYFAEINGIYYSPAAVDKQEYSVTSTRMFAENEYNDTCNKTCTGL